MLRYLSLILVLAHLSCGDADQEISYDVIVYGGTSAGIVAAIQAKKMGKSVLILEPSEHIGGLTTGGLGATDIGNKHVIGGMSRDFYKAIYQHYLNEKNWKYQHRADYMKNEEPDSSQWTFEPGVAMQVFQNWIVEFQLEIKTGERLDLDDGVIKEDETIQAIKTESGNRYHGKMFIDATYEGDLMAMCGVSYTFGREANDVYGENLNGIQAQYAIYHQFPDGVNPYVDPEDPSSGLLYNVNPGIAEDGSGDHRIQGYCFRMCLTNMEENRVAFSKPEGYDEKEYELLFRAIEAGYKGPFFIMSMMPNHKTDSNNKGPFSTDFIGMNFDYPEGNYLQRDSIIDNHERYQKGLMWTLANHPRVPDSIRRVWQEWGLPRDEFVENGNWSPQLYIREARRMVSDFVMTEHHCTQDSVTAAESIGMGAYTMDSHHMQRYVNAAGHVKNEGDVEVGGFSPYPISYRAIVPKKEECTNLLVPVCLSASHIAFGSIRMEPVFMILGQSAATAACLALDKDVSVQELEYEVLRIKLLEDHQIISYQN